MRYLLTGEPANQPGGANPNPVFALPPSLPPLIPGAFRLDCDIEAGGSRGESYCVTRARAQCLVLSCLVSCQLSRRNPLCVYIYVYIRADKKPIAYGSPFSSVTSTQEISRTFSQERPPVRTTFSLQLSVESDEGSDTYLGGSKTNGALIGITMPTAQYM